MAGERAFGPKVTTKRSCFDCPACKTERYVCQGDSGCDVYCEAAGRRHIGDTNWDTPNWCPVLVSPPPAPPKEAEGAACEHGVVETATTGCRKCYAGRAGRGTP